MTDVWHYRPGYHRQYDAGLEPLTAGIQYRDPDTLELLTDTGDYQYEYCGPRSWTGETDLQSTWEFSVLELLYLQSLWQAGFADIDPAKLPPPAMAYGDFSLDFTGTVVQGLA
jgi:hypothetical protein